MPTKGKGRQPICQDNSRMEFSRKEPATFVSRSVSRGGANLNIVPAGSFALFFGDFLHHGKRLRTAILADSRQEGDRKSTRLNSSHANISYAVFCLKKKKQTRNRTQEVK